MFCSKCGKNVDDGVGFCPSCGAKVGGGAAACAQQPAGESGKVSGAGRGKFVEYLVGAVFAIVVACGVLYRIIGTGPDLREEATEMLKETLVDDFKKHGELEKFAKYVKLTDVRDCYLVKQEKSYEGLAEAEYTANKVGENGEARRVVIQYSFTLLYDGENMILQDAQVSSDVEESKLTSFLEGLATEDKGEGGRTDGGEGRKLSEMDVSEITGADIIRGNSQKESGFSAVQLAKIQKRLAGRTLSFENAHVVDVSREPFTGRLTVLFNCEGLAVEAEFVDSKMVDICEDLDEGETVKSLSGRVAKGDDFSGIIPVFYIKNASVVVR